MCRTFAAAIFAAVSVAGCNDTSAPPPALTLKDAAALAAQLDTIHGGLGTEQLRSFSAMALPMLAAGFSFHNLDSSFLGKTIEWNSLQRDVFLTTRPGSSSQALRVTLYELDNTGLPSPTSQLIGSMDVMIQMATRWRK